MAEKILGGESNRDLQSDKVIAGGENSKPSSIPEKVSTDNIADFTTKGGLDMPASDYEKVCNWQTILSENPFEVLYLDYEQYNYITPEIVLKNYNVLHEFWNEKLIGLNGVAREKISKKFGAETVSKSLEKLKREYEKLKTSEGIINYYKEVTNKRIAKGIDAITDIVEMAFEDGEVTKAEANKIITKGLTNGLRENEVRTHLLELFKERGFKPRATKKKEDEFDNQWMTDEKWKIAQARTTTILGQSVSTLEEIGELLFNQKKEANNFISKSLYNTIDKLTNYDKAEEFDKIEKSEKDVEKKYLKVVYHLNPSLPFRIDSSTYNTINQLFEKTALDYDLFQKVFTYYEKGHLRIWLSEVDPSNSRKYTKEVTYNDYLKFVYSVDRSHPFYIKNERFATPKDLVDKALVDNALWNKISEVMLNGQIFVWLQEIGKADWIKSYNERTEPIFASKYHSDEELKLAAVQTLLQVIDTDIENPKISSNTKDINLPAIEGSHVIQKKIALKLENVGFVKAIASLDQNIPGVSVLVEKDIVFHSQAGIKEHQLILNIESLELVKNREYSFNIKVNTLYETLTMPVKLKAVFPKKAYSVMLVKYAAIFGAIFGLFRFVLGSVGNHQSWLSEDPLFGGFVPMDINSAYLPQFYFLYILLFLFFILIFIISARIIKKYEKL